MMKRLFKYLKQPVSNLGLVGVNYNYPRWVNILINIFISTIFIFIAIKTIK